MSRHNDADDLAPPPRADPDDIFYQLDQEVRYLEKELAEYTSGTRRKEPYPKGQVEALALLRQFPLIARPAFNDLLTELPVAISLRSRSMELNVPMTSQVDFPSTSYARFKCIYDGPVRDSPRCETWTFIPYVTDTFLRGLAGVLAVAANLNVVGGELESELATGFKQMFCSAHEESLKDEQASKYAVRCRPVVEQWRDQEQLYRNVGKLHCQETKTTVAYRKLV